MTIKTKSFATFASIACAFNVSAEEKQPDPSDLTETNTSAYVSINNKGNFKGSISGDMTFDNGQKGMFTLEAAMDNTGDYSDSRFQYFHVFDTANSIVPKAAASLDVLDNSLFTSVSAGATLAINSGVKGLNIFPRVGLLAGQYSDETLSAFAINDDSAIGGSAALYMFYTAGNDGTYFGLYPEYNYLGGDVDMSILTTNLLMSTPFNADRTRWGQIKIVNTDTSIKGNHQNFKNNDTVVWANYKFYF
ncbi:hypothetical protein AB6E53_01430 [Vibrio breoganii]|uniref:hypothetical protein n=1 Tax=Vibrio breoganii TaxID=553239 RepID=UPI00080DA024|nr:hypothetical protein [Vibrio breoganii]OCH76381.1 hypothetical protein A6D95_09215 [Vibrio breoganii]PML30588.1 hypothetical protein BCT82_04320 [Vibrio breoganii]TKG25563.1 hypothetical protein FCV87_15990 [Vibrio breoganii]